MTERVLLAVADGVATVTLNRPDALNALDRDMATGLKDTMQRLAHDESVRAVVLCGAGEHFMAGGDVKHFHAHLTHPQAERRMEFQGELGDIHAAVAAIRAMKKPVIAKVRGAAAGFGFSLMIACDLVVVARSSMFTLAYCHIGTSPDGGATWFLPRIVGQKKAMELALLGDRFDAETALAIGLINRIADDTDLDGTVDKLARRLADGPAPALGNTKALLNAALSNPLAAHLQAEEASFIECIQSADFAEGVTAFAEKRKAAFGKG